jgi:L-asparaginase
MGKPRILVIYTGGTIGMRKTPAGYRPEPGSMQRLIAEIPRFFDPEIPAFEIDEFDPLLDSSDMNPGHWLRIADLVRRRYAEYDGFLVVHGTDTMSFTASALSFMLEDLTKPVILTGSQIPLEETRNDAQHNLLTSLMILGRHHGRLPEVMVYFADRLLRGNRSTKVSVSDFAAFDSPNWPPLGRVGMDIHIDWSRVLPPRPAAHAAPPAAPAAPPAAPVPVHVVEMGDAAVTAFRIFPGLKPELLAAVLAPPVQGVVLECYGAGNAPTADPAFMRVISDATARGVVIVDVTQTLRGSADLRLYATGRALLDAGVVSGYDMTAEAALAKLFYLFAKGAGNGGSDPARVKELMQTPLCGELTRLDAPARVPFRAADRASDAT